MKEPLGRRFWFVWSASAVVYLGNGLLTGAMPLFAASLTRDPRLVSLVNVLSISGVVLLGLISGVMVDRFDRIRIMWQVSVVKALIIAAFAGVVIAGDDNLAALYVVSFLIGLCNPFFDNSSGSLLPDLVRAEQLDRANSLTQLSLVLGANMLGPAIGAALFVAATEVTFVLDAVIFAVGALLIWRFGGRAAPPQTKGDAGLTGELREGVAYLFGHPILRASAAMVSLMNLVTGAMVGILVLYALQVLHEPEAVYGWLVASFAAGGVLASWTTPRLVPSVGPGPMAVVSVLTFGVSVLVLGLTASLPITMTALAIGGFGSLTWNVVTISYRQREVPKALLGRVTSAYRLVALGAVPLGSAGGGLVAHRIGIGETYALGGLLLIAVAVVLGRTLLTMPRVADHVPVE